MSLPNVATRDEWLKARGRNCSKTNLNQGGT